MLTPHERTLVLQHQAIKRSEHLSPRLAMSRTLQAVLFDLSQVELDSVKTATTFAEVMTRVQAIKEKRK